MSEKTYNKIKKIVTFVFYTILAILAVWYITMTIYVRIEYADTPISELPSWTWLYMPR